MHSVLILCLGVMVGGMISIVTMCLVQINRYGRALVPFINRFPKDTELYKLMTTKPGEGVFGGYENA